MANKTKQDADLGADTAIDEVGDEPRVYELGFHLDPELPAEEVKKAYQAVRDAVNRVRKTTGL